MSVPWQRVSPKHTGLYPGLGYGVFSYGFPASYEIISIWGDGAKGVKKHRRPRSGPRKGRAHRAAPPGVSALAVTPLPSSQSPTRSSTSSRSQKKRANGKTVSRQASTPHSTRRYIAAQTLSSLVQAPLNRLMRMNRSERADAIMLVLPVALVSLTIAVAQWSEAARKATQPYAQQLTAGAARALVGLPRPMAITTVERRLDTLHPAAAVLSEAVRANDLRTTLKTHDAQPDEVRAASAPSTPVALAGKPPTANTIQQPESTAAATPAGPLVAALDSAAPQVPSPVALSDVPVSSGQVPDPLTGVPAPAGIMGSRTPEMTVAVRTPIPGPLGIDDGETQCSASSDTPQATQFLAQSAVGISDPEAFGVVLARAAREQLDDFVIYNDRYTRIPYPMGDVHPMYGVCTDVIIRAYRLLGIDLQELVQKTRTGSGDPNIDHRRVETLRKFFSRFGESLPVSGFAEDYRPGDIVTYWRPQNRNSRTHIAIVSDLSGPSGRPLIIHNRGWGTQQEDGLFVDKITGHFRFTGLKPSPGVNNPAQATTRSKRVLNKPAVTQSKVIRAGLSVETDPASVKAADTVAPR